MNTAPKLQSRLISAADQWDEYAAASLTSSNATLWRNSAQLLRDAAEALAPPSGEGVDNPNVAVLHRIMHYLPDASDRAAVDHAAAELSVLWRHYQRAATQSIDPDSRNFKEGMKVGLSCENMLADKVRNPVCDICGARNAAEAETLCKPSGDNCPGSEWPLSNLWALTTPQSAPEDVLAACLKDVQAEETDAGLMIGYRAANKLLQRFRKALTPPPPASQERGGEEYEFEVWQDDTMQAGGCTSTLETALAEGNHYAMMYGQDGDVEVRYYARTKLNPSATSLPSSAAEPDRFGVASPFDHTKHPVVRPDSHGVAGAAEQDSSAAEDHPGIMDGHGRLPWVAKIPAIPYPDAAEQAKPDDCPSCGQPQAGELPPSCAAARTLSNETLVEVALQAAGRASLIDSEIHRNRYRECRTELLRRLAGGVTVDDEMTKRALNAQPFTDSNSAIRVWQLLSVSGGEAPDVMRAALVAALGAK